MRKFSENANSVLPEQKQVCVMHTMHVHWFAGNWPYSFDSSRTLLKLSGSLVKLSQGWYILGLKKKF